MALNPEDLAPLEVALLGVLCVGLPPSKAAGDDRFRIDHVTAVVTGLQAEGRPDVHLLPDGVAVTPAFRLALRETIVALTEKGVLADQAAGMPAAAGNFEAGLAIDMVQPDEHPALLDRYLGQLCMEVLFNIPAVYPYLMGRYAASGEVWRRLREAGYGN
ncbi:MAG TPA: hypothetical protein PKA49_03605 [Tepidiformaceae bacterium]|nr:hypothetical protein [Thermoflexaceae bacterium]HMS57918.1 hypothetical protein [Tepidiformaceae bacterium]